MSEAPKKIWIYGKQWQESPEFYPMTFESDKPIVSKEPYIRADIVDELVEALKEVMDAHSDRVKELSYQKGILVGDSRLANARAALAKARGEG